MKELVTNPSRFFEVRLGREVSFRLPLTIVLMVGILPAISGVVLLLKLAGAIPGVPVAFFIPSILITLAIGLAAALLTWLLIAGVSFAVSVPLKGSGSFKRAFEFIGCGFLPILIGSILAFAVTIYVLSGVEALMVVEALNAPIMQAVWLMGFIFLLWSANIWVFAMKHARNLSTRNALVTVCTAVGVYLLLQYVVLPAVARAVLGVAV